MADTHGAREALTKSSFMFQEPDPEDDIQFRRLASKQQNFKKLITLSIKKPEDMHDSINKLKAQEGVTENCRITAGMILTGVGYLDSAQRELTNLSEANKLFVEMMNELVLLDPELETECNEKIQSAEEAWDKYNGRLLDVIQKTARTFQSSPGASAPNSRENSPPRAPIVQRRTVNAKHLLPSILGAECNTKEYRKFRREFTIWADTAFPDGHAPEDTWGTLNNRLDSG